ncbi:MAG: hypothetical protein M1594_01630 [Candidatus Marsarchaeota archaeon]|nr:hypothetical protein [Candidatus Marsarchaeota archaeon]
MKKAYLLILAVIIIVLASASLVLISSHNNSTQNAQSNQINVSLVNKTVGERQSNFLIQAINSNSVTGLIYTEYPVAYLSGTAKTINIGDTVGYSCDGTLAKLVSINNQTAVFELNTTKSFGGCPI